VLIFASSTAAFYAFGRCRFYRTGYFHCPTVKVDLPQRVRLQLETVIHWASQVLLAAEIALGRLHGNMPEQELNLLQLATAVVA
jgi:hypothetical protein